MIIEIGAPVYNEESGIGLFLSSLLDIIKDLSVGDPDLEFSLLLVNDGSTDKTLEIINNYQFSGFSKVRVISFSRNFGHSAAISALIDNFAGDCLVLMDADMQDNPKLIPELIAKWKDGYFSVQVARTKRSESRFFKFGHLIFTRIFSLLSRLRSDVGIFGLYDKEVVNAIRQYPERLRFIPGIISSVGFKRAYLPAAREKRAEGNSRVGYAGLIRLGLLAWLSYSAIPIHFITGLGFIISILSLLAGAFVILIKLTTDLAIPGWASLLSAQFLLGGIIIFSLGVVGQYIGIIFEEVKNRPQYIIEKNDEIYRL